MDFAFCVDYSSVAALENCRKNLNHFYLKKINQRQYSERSPKLGGPVLYKEVTIGRKWVLPKRYYEKDANKRPDYPIVTVDELLNGGDGKVNLIEGDPGSGKTTFALQICKDWAEGKLLKGNIVFWIPLHHYKSVTTPTELFDELGYPEMISYAQQNNGKGLVLILDGWDELPNHLQTASDSLFRGIIFDSVRPFAQSTIIVTSRPSCSGEIANIVEVLKTYYQILGFDWQNVMTYIREYFHDDTSAERLLAFLKSNEYLCQHFYIPISVAIMCFVYNSDGEETPKTLSRLYERFVMLCLYSNVSDAYRQDLRKCETLCNMPENLKSLFHTFCKIAFDMLKDERLILNEEELKLLQDNSDSLQLSNFDGFGLLHIDNYTNSLATMETAYSFFSYRAVQEFLAAIFIKDSGSIIDILDEHFHEDSYLLNVFPFLFGLLPKDFLKPLAKKLMEIFDRNHNLLSFILYCLFEAHDETICREFGRAFGEDRNICLYLHTLLDCHYACYFISVCGAKRLNITMTCGSFGISTDLYCETIAKYLHSASADVASFSFNAYGALSHKGMRQFAKAISNQRDMQSLELMGSCPPGHIEILCDSISRRNSQITSLRLPNAKLGKNDLEKIGSVLRMCKSLKILHMGCSPSEGVCLDSSLSFYNALCQTKSLQKLVLPWWTLSQTDSKLFGNLISQNRSLKELCIKVATANCLDPILNGLAHSLAANASITTFRIWLDETGTCNTLGECLNKCLVPNSSLNILDFSDGQSNLRPPQYVSWSSTQVISICTGLYTNTTLITLDISGCYIDNEACNAVCNMLSQNNKLQHLFLNPVHLEKQEAVCIIENCKNNTNLELLSFVHWPPKRLEHGQGSDPFHYSTDEEVKYLVQQIQKLRQEPFLNIYW